MLASYTLYNPSTSLSVNDKYLTAVSRFQEKPGVRFINKFVYIRLIVKELDRKFVFKKDELDLLMFIDSIKY